MADQDPPSPTPTAVTLHYGLKVLSVMESHSGRLWETGNSQHSAIHSFLLSTDGEVDE
jgi:hypothetical protein